MKLTGVVGLYLNPLDGALALGVRTSEGRFRQLDRAWAALAVRERRRGIAPRVDGFLHHLDRVSFLGEQPYTRPRTDSRFIIPETHEVNTAHGTGSR